MRVPVSAGEVATLEPELRYPIVVHGGRAQQWTEGAYEVWWLEGHVTIEQGPVLAHADQAVLWIDRQAPSSDEPSKVLAYLEGEVTVAYRNSIERLDTARPPMQTIVDRRWFGRLRTRAAVDVRVMPQGGEPRFKPGLYQRGRDAWRAPLESSVRTTQFMQEEIPAPANPQPAGMSVRVRRRSSTPIQITPVPGGSANQTVSVVSGGVVVTIEGVAVPQLGNIGRIVVETDRMVFWGPRLTDLVRAEQAGRKVDVPIELYLEGNIVFRQGDRMIYADRMYYNVTQEYGVVLGAEVYTPVPNYEGLVRLKADVLQQLDHDNFQAYGGAATSSRLGVPQYWFQSERITFRDEQRPLVDPLTGQVMVDPRSGDPAVEHDVLATSRNNFVFIAGVPVFYWPIMATNLTKPTFYVDNVKIKNDDIFGFQAIVDFDAYQVLGLRNPPPGTEWNFTLGYLTKRGTAAGTEFRYDRPDFWILPGPTRGYFDAYFQRDHGLDNLGGSRRALEPETNNRGRIVWQHRQELPDGYQLTGEFGWISDRNFLQEYFPTEWYDRPDELTRLELKRYSENRELSVQAAVRLNDFFTQTQWLPRVDHYVVGQSLLFDSLTWYAHSQAGYAQFQVATAPTDPADAAGWHLLPWEVPANGVRAATRQELDLPLDAGPVKVVPYVLGELAYWGEDLSASALTRAYGQTGVRASLPIWTVDPLVQSALLNLNGLAQKWFLDADLFWSGADQDVANLQLYDPLDDDVTEDFRRRFTTTSPFDPRSYLIRSDIQRWVGSPTVEVADDLAQLRLGAHGRWQTKRGLPGQERIVDWIAVDLEGSYFPRPDRDDFGQEFGMLTYDFRWYLGDRLTLLSDGYADTFINGLRTFSVGGVISRPERGKLYIGFRSLSGPVASNILLASLNYRMSDKWIADIGSSVAFGDSGNARQVIGLTRIGESALVRVGFYANESQSNVGVQFSVEPRFLRRGKLGRVAGIQLPPAGAYGLE